jgi:hypothetical protein
MATPEAIDELWQHGDEQQQRLGFQALVFASLHQLPGLRRLTSTIVMKDVVDHRPLTAGT